MIFDCLKKGFVDAKVFFFGQEPAFSYVFVHVMRPWPLPSFLGNAV